MRKSAQTEQDVLPIVGQCLEGVQRCTDSINEKEVSLMMSSMTLHYDPQPPSHPSHPECIYRLSFCSS